MKNLDEHVLMLGKFWGNFNSLELILRVYLAKKYSEKEWGLELDVGDKVTASHLTNYDSFAVIVDKYNDAVEARNRIDAGAIIAFRDALAHGRVTTKDDVPMTVIKFGKVDRATGEVVVAFRQELTAAYMQERITQARELMLKVHGLLQREFGG